jgi:Immunity protein 10
LDARVLTSFDASAVAFERDDRLNARYLVLAEHADGSGRRVEVQRALEFDDQDLALGMDTYCVVTEEQATHYGGVLHWRIEGSTLHVDLTEEAGRAMGASAFRIALPESELATVQRALLVLLA